MDAVNIAAFTVYVRILTVLSLWPGQSCGAVCSSRGQFTLF